ncbi:MAG TPA: hypothetical protein PLT27_07190 [Nitrospira sp.]|nr:hypothetical protein [Nitrospira sp.]
MKRTMPLALATMIAVAGLALATTGCSAFAQKDMPVDVADRIAREKGTADDHMAAAMLYLQKAKQVQTQAEQYQAVASTIKPLEDPKGIRRSGLITAAQTRRNDAAELQQLYAAHYDKAQTLLGKQQPQ